MTVDFPFLVLAAVLLWFPRQWLRVGSVFKRRRTSAARGEKEPWHSREPGDMQVRFGVEFAKFRNYVDLLRAGAGSLAFAGGLGIPACLSVADGAPRSQFYTMVALRLAIMLAGLVIQMVRFERGKLTFYPAIFYIAGLTLGLCGAWAAVFAFILIWAFNVLLASAQGFLTVYTVMVLVFGLAFARQDLLAVISAGVLAYTPVLLSLLANRPLVIPSRKGTHPAR
ncbi:MAG: hypothetical protein NTV51_19275 [Verrucomicrobia bacterium]|nr:hypothetical protein [Verrucomicrobiota bacterium]